MNKLPLLLAILIAPRASPMQAFACSCMYFETEEKQRAQAYANADVIILGTPVEVSTNDQKREHTYTIGIEKAWKGQIDAYADISTAIDSATCGIDLQLDEPVVIFAHEHNGKLSTGLCSGTVPASEDMITWLSSYEISCDPYICKNGDVFPSCTDDGRPINYFVEPCRFSHEEKEEESYFSDVPTNHPYYTPITFVRNEGIVQGYADGTYLPEKKITRDEFTKIIVEATISQEEISTCTDANLFTDISEDDWSYSYICIAKKLGIVDGYEGGKFIPTNTINFAEAAKIVVNAFGIQTDEGDFRTVWWKPYVYALARIGGLPTTFTDPNQAVTRGDMADIVYRVMMGM